MGPGLKSIHKFKNRHLKNSSTPKESESNSSTPVSSSPRMPTASLLNAATERLEAISVESASALALLSYGKSAGSCVSYMNNRLHHCRSRGSIQIIFLPNGSTIFQFLSMSCLI
jgi:hypothetical protein